MGKTKKETAMKVGIDVKTLRKYTRTSKLPSEMKTPHDWATRKDPFEKDWTWVKDLIIKEPALEAKSLMERLVEKDPEHYSMSHLRTLQRRFVQERAENGPDKEVIFLQSYDPGSQCQLDFTSMKELNITIAKEAFDHELFHMRLSFSKWEYVMVCHGESFDNLAKGFEDALWTLGGIPSEVRTDNLSAAWTSIGKGSFKITQNWEHLTKHYNVQPTSNNPGQSHENGLIERSHYLTKNAIKQALIIRGSSDFTTLEEYYRFLNKLVYKRNALIDDKLQVERRQLRKLPKDKWLCAKMRKVRVRSTSLVEIDKIHYSVPSRLIGEEITAYIQKDKIEFFYRHTLVHTVDRENKSSFIDYRHFIPSLARKPGAFKNYINKAALFPCLVFKRAFERCVKAFPSIGHKIYLNILNLAKMHGEESVRLALIELEDKDITPDVTIIRRMLEREIVFTDVEVKLPNLQDYDALFYQEVAQSACY